MKRALILTDAAIVKSVWFVCLVVVTLSTTGPTAFALDPMGPPRAGLGKDQFNIGADLSFSRTDLNLTGGKWTNPSTTPTSGTLVDGTVELEALKLYATAGYGFSHNWEAFLGIGATKSEFGDDLYSVGEDFDGGIGLGIRGGVKATILEFPEYDFQVGGLIQLSWANYDGKLNAPTQVAPDFVDINLVEMQIALGVSYWWKDGITLYAGPFVHYVKGDLEQLDISGFDNKWDIDEGPTFGAYIGAQMDLKDNCVVNIEYLRSSDASVIGAGLVMTY